MITHEKARKLVSKIEYKSLLQNDLYDYITQQEKKDKLLELYRKYAKSLDMEISLEIYNEIQAIEREL